MRTLPALLATLILLLLGAGPAAAEEEVPRGTWPLRPEPEVVGSFDPPDSPYGAGHRGVDLLGRAGQTVHAAMGGRVTFAGMLAGRGVVVVDHGDTRTTYEPVTASVGVGEPVAEGAPLGALQAAGSHCYPRSCLHWGWIRNADDVYLDPLLLVGLGPVRLLPLWRDEPVTTTRSAASPRSPYDGWRPLLAILGPVP